MSRADDNLRPPRNIPPLPVSRLIRPDVHVYPIDLVLRGELPLKESLPVDSHSGALIHEAEGGEIFSQKKICLRARNSKLTMAKRSQTG